MFVVLFVITRKSWFIFFSSGPKIGEGQFSKVFIGKYFGDHVAVKKQIRKEEGLDTYLLRELAVLKNVSHKNLVGYIGACNELARESSSLNSLYIVTEYCQVWNIENILLWCVAQGGDLLDILLSEEGLGWKFRLKIALGAASALKYLHRQNLIHRDIKSSNMLLSHDWTCKVRFSPTWMVTSLYLF